MDARGRTAAVWHSRDYRGAVLLAMLVAALFTGACRSAAGAASDVPGPQAGGAGTISGTIRGPENFGPVDGRIVEVVNVETQERQRITTDTTGTFSLKVKAGVYRVDLPLRDGETLIRQPGVIRLTRPEAATHVDFLIGTGRVSRPRVPAYRTDDGLGSPIA